MRHICIHGHFYQPPRENPWLEAIEIQDSAAPYHDWNERITVECYAANAASRVLDGQNRIVEILNNYSRISFNFGPTLLSWLEEHRPDVHDAILRADELSLERFNGHGAAIAQVYNHLIMPLANRRDKRTQIIWGLRDFEHRFGRKAEGIWLAETAVDLETLELLAEQGVDFTILAPYQAGRCRPLDGGHPWQDVSGGRIDPTRPYLQRLPSGRSINLFFYDGPISRAIAFERLLDRGEALAGRLVSAFREGRDRPQLVHIATDGETYGHHHRYGEMALSYALKHIERHGLARVTVYGEFLELSPPEWEVDIVEDTAWSCAHGIERWRSDCGCHTGGHPGWNQRWRGPLRDALDWLRDEIGPRFERVAADIFPHPWAARDHYIDLILDRNHARVDHFLTTHARRTLDSDEKILALELLELQRQAMLMYTSCGWFFNDLAGIETVQILRYAARVLQLARQALGVDLEEGFLERLELAESNVSEHGNGRDIYEAQVRPSMLSLRDVGAHYAIASLFEPTGARTETYCYEIDSLRRSVHDAGRAKMALGRARVRSGITRRAQTFEYGVMHMGDHNVDGGIRLVQPDEEIEQPYAEAVAAFERAEFPTLIRLLDHQFGEEVFSLRSLFRDEQRRVIEFVTQKARRDAEAVLRQLYARHAPLLSFLNDLDSPALLELKAAARAALHAELERLILSDKPPQAELFAILKEARNAGVELDWDSLSYVTHEELVAVTQRWRAAPHDLDELKHVASALAFVALLPFDVSLWEVQNAYFEALSSTWLEQRMHADAGDARAQAWVDVFDSITAGLNISPKASA